MNKGMIKTVITKEEKVKNRVLDISPKCSKLVSKASRILGVLPKINTI